MSQEKEMENNSREKSSPVTEICPGGAIFGGHDHMYYIGRGIKNWEGYDFNEKQLGAEQDDGLQYGLQLDRLTDDANPSKVL